MYDNDTIVALGDSLTFGTGAKPEYSYPTQLSQLIGWQVVNEGTPGDKTEDILARLDRVLKTHQPKLVILCIGGNDFLRKVPKTIIRSNIERIIDTVRQSNSQIMLIAVPEPGLFLSDSELYLSLTDTHNVALLEDVLSDYLSEDDLKADAIHLNAQGYKQLAVDIFDFLKNRGAL